MNACCLTTMSCARPSTRSIVARHVEAGTVVTAGKPIFTLMDPDDRLDPRPISTRNAQGRSPSGNGRGAAAVAAASGFYRHGDPDRHRKRPGERGTPRLDRLRSMPGAGLPWRTGRGADHRGGPARGGAGARDCHHRLSTAMPGASGWCRTGGAQRSRWCSATGPKMRGWRSSAACQRVRASS